MSPRLALILILAYSLAACRDTPGARKIPKDVAFVKSDAGILRSDPHPTAPELDNLAIGSKLFVLDRTENRIRIGARDDYWYQIRTDGDLTGWIYGASLTFSESDIKDGRDQVRVIDTATLEKGVIGKWWELLEDGSYGRRKVYFWPDGIAKYRLTGDEVKDGVYSLQKGAVQVNNEEGKSVIVLDPFVMGREEMRLKGSVNGKELVFILGNANPEAPEIGQEATENEAEQQQEKTETENPQ